MLTLREPTTADVVLGEVLDDLTRRGLQHALVRPPSRDGRGQLEADLLVEPRARAAVEALLARHGFARRPAWGRRPHRFHLRPVIGVAGAGSAGDVEVAGPAGSIDWLKIDLVTDLCFGRWHEIPAQAAAACLAQRRPTPDRLTPADELIGQLLHSLLDGKGLGAKGRERLAHLAPLAGAPTELATWAAPEGGGWPEWSDIVRAISSEEWAALEAMGPPISQRIVSDRRSEVAFRSATNRAGQRLVKVLTAVAGRGWLVALVGPDGTGKSTLAGSMAASLAVPSRTLYGGTYRSGTTESRVPGMATAAVAGRLLSTRAQVAWHRSRGRLVVLDRHPVEARPGPDEDLSPKARLRRRALSVLLPMPDLLIALDAPAALLHERRPEHDVAHLEADRQRHLDLAAHTTGSEVVDAAAPADVVRDRTVGLVWERVVARRPVRRLGTDHLTTTGSAA
ncbi:hypothetical protein [Aquihabitans sp. McL0605]|uniref:hypothetical protein n=1 Tax=Aquihabitans sp. McL0605 TaxID=3415671 RepID=UPI003CF43144